MLVKKRDGTHTQFQITKIEKSLSQVFYNTGRFVNIRPLVEKILEKIQKLHFDTVSVDELHEMLLATLVENGFRDTADNYRKYKINRDLLRMEREKPKITILQNYIAASKYAKVVEKGGSRRLESWEETVQRTMDMHRQKYEFLGAGFLTTLDNIQQMVIEKKVLPSMRSLQFGGEAIMQCNERMYNCCFTLIDRVTVFKEVLYLLLCGCGVGYSVDKTHVEKLSAVVPLKKVGKREVVLHHTVGDTIMGWAEAVDVLMKEMLGGEGRYVEFNYSHIRPEGSLLRTSGGLAPGHLSLKESLENIREILYAAQGRKLRPIECHDIICHLALAVLSGGIRRSSLMCLFGSDDTEMLNSKVKGVFDPNSTNSQRTMANNSMILLRDRATKSDFERLMKINQLNYGEPGFIFLDKITDGCNPCGEIGLTGVAEDGITSGVGFCNLTEVNVATCVDAADFYQRCIAAAVLGTLQAGYTDFSFINPIIAREDALLGVSLTGIMDNWEMMDKEVLEKAVEVIRDTNVRLAKEIGINPAKRLTTIKPSGTASLLLGGVGSGIHPHHGRRYFRRVTANPNEPAAKIFKSINPHAVEKKPDGDWSLVFPVEAKDNAITLKDLSSMEFLNRVFHMYQYWVFPGGTHYSRLTHNVSATVVVKEGELDKILDLVWENRFKIAALSFVNEYLDTIYAYAPRELLQSIKESRWNELCKETREVFYQDYEVENTAKVFLDSACSGGACEL